MTSPEPVVSGEKEVLPQAVPAQTPPTRPCGSPPGGRGSAKTKFSALKPSQQVVVQSFLDPANPGYLNQTKAYQQAHPRTTVGSARVGGHDTLTNPNVRLAVLEESERLGYDKDSAVEDLLWNKNRSRELDRLGDHREAVIAWAKLTGNLIEKREVKTLTDDARDEIRRVVSETQRNGNH